MDYIIIQSRENIREMVIKSCFEEIEPPPLRSNIVKAILELTEMCKITRSRQYSQRNDKTLRRSQHHTLPPLCCTIRMPYYYELMKNCRLQELHISGFTKECIIYRPISLLSHTNANLLQLLLYRIKLKIENEIIDC